MSLDNSPLWRWEFRPAPAPGGVVSLVTTPARLSGKAGDTFQLATVAYDGPGGTGGVVATPALTYASDDAAVATVSATGLVTLVAGSAFGSTAVRATVTAAPSIASPDVRAERYLGLYVPNAGGFHALANGDPMPASTGPTGGGNSDTRARLARASSRFKLRLGNYRTDLLTGDLTGDVAPVTHRASMLAGGLNVEATWAGLVPKLVTGGELPVSDELVFPAPLAAGSFPHFRLFSTFDMTGGLHAYTNRQTEQLALNESASYVASGAVDGHLGAPTAPGAGNFAAAMTPLAVYSTDVEPGEGVTIFGDSGSFGANDGGNATGEVGHVDRALRQRLNLPAINYSSGGAKFETFLSGMTVRRAQAAEEMTRYALGHFGLNDVRDDTLPVLTLVQLQTKASAFIAACVAMGKDRVIMAEIQPHSDSTDQWATVEGQTPHARFGPGQVASLFNAWLRTLRQAGTIYAILESAAVASAISPDSGIFRTNGLPYVSGVSMDGLHLNPPGHQDIADAYCADWFRPQGYTRAAAVGLSSTTPSVLAGETVDVTVTVTGAGGERLAGRVVRVTFETANAAAKLAGVGRPCYALTDADGEAVLTLDGVSAGTATMTVGCEDAPDATATVTVAAPPSTLPAGDDALVAALGGKSAVPAIYDKRAGQTVAGGHLTAWADAYGEGRAPDLTPNGGGYAGSPTGPLCAAPGSVVQFRNDFNHRLSTPTHAAYSTQAHSRTIIYVGAILDNLSTPGAFGEQDELGGLYSVRPGGEGAPNSNVAGLRLYAGGTSYEGDSCTVMPFMGVSAGVTVRVAIVTWDNAGNRWLGVMPNQTQVTGANSIDFSADTGTRLVLGTMHPDYMDRTRINADLHAVLAVDHALSAGEQNAVRDWAVAQFGAAAA